MTTITATPNSLTTPTDHIDLEKLVKSKLQPMPASAQRILELIRDVDVSTNAIAEAIGYDHVLTSRVLRLANSPVYALRRRVTRIGDAVSAIGVRSIYDIVMFGNRLRQFFQGHVGDKDRRVRLGAFGSSCDCRQNSGVVFASSRSTRSLYLWLTARHRKNFTLSARSKLIICRLKTRWMKKVSYEWKKFCLDSIILKLVYT